MTITPYTLFKTIACIVKAMQFSSVMWDMWKQQCKDNKQNNRKKWMKTFVFGLTVSKFEGLRHLVMSSQPFRTSGWPRSKARWTYSKFMKFEKNGVFRLLEWLVLTWKTTSLQTSDPLLSVSRGEGYKNLGGGLIWSCSLPGIFRCSFTYKSQGKF